MHNSRTHVKQHLRTSKNGKEHVVKDHRRSVTVSDLMPGKPTPKKAAAAAGFATAVTGLAYVMSTITSVTAAMVWAVILVCLGVLTYLFMSKGQRKSARRKMRDRAAEGTKRYLRLWMHHRIAKFDKDRPQMRSAKPQEAKAAKAAKTKAKPRNANEGVTHDTHFYCVGDGRLCKPGKHYDYEADKAKKAKNREHRAAKARNAAYEATKGQPGSNRAQSEAYLNVMFDGDKAKVAEEMRKAYGP